MGFTPTTTAYDVATALATEIQGRAVLVTGCSPGGLGYETARVIAAHGAKVVVVAARSAFKLKESKEAILKDTPGADVRELVLDLADVASIRKAAAEVLLYDFKLDALIANAGIMAPPTYEIVHGTEAQFGTNHLGPFLFTNLIKSALANPSRVVSVSSDGHAMSPIRWDDINYGEGKAYDKWQGYGQSKTANILFAVEINKRWKEAGIKAYSLHPGVVPTNLGRDLTKEDFDAIGIELDKNGNMVSTPEAAAKWPHRQYKTLQTGAATHIFAAFSPELEDLPGAFCMDARVANEKASPHAVDPEQADSGSSARRCSATLSLDIAL